MQTYWNKTIGPRDRVESFGMGKMNNILGVSAKANTGTYHRSNLNETMWVLEPYKVFPSQYTGKNLVTTCFDEASTNPLVNVIPSLDASSTETDTRIAIQQFNPTTLKWTPTLLEKGPGVPANNQWGSRCFINPPGSYMFIGDYENGIIQIFKSTTTSWSPQPVTSLNLNLNAGYNIVFAVSGTTAFVTGKSNVWSLVKAVNEAWNATIILTMTPPSAVEALYVDCTASANLVTVGDTKNNIIYTLKKDGATWTEITTAKLDLSSKQQPGLGVPAVTDRNPLTGSLRMLVSSTSTEVATPLYGFIFNSHIEKWVELETIPNTEIGYGSQLQSHWISDTAVLHPDKGVDFYKEITLNPINTFSVTQTVPNPGTPVTGGVGQELRIVLRLVIIGDPVGGEFIVEVKWPEDSFGTFSPPFQIISVTPGLPAVNVETIFVATAASTSTYNVTTSVQYNNPNIAANIFSNISDNILGLSLQITQQPPSDITLTVTNVATGGVIIGGVINDDILIDVKITINRTQLINYIFTLVLPSIPNGVFTVFPSTITIPIGELSKTETITFFASNDVIDGTGFNFIATGPNFAVTTVPFYIKTSANQVIELTLSITPISVDLGETQDVTFTGTINTFPVGGSLHMSILPISTSFGMFGSIPQMNFATHLPVSVVTTYIPLLTATNEEVVFTTTLVSPLPTNILPGLQGTGTTTINTSGINTFSLNTVATYNGYYDVPVPVTLTIALNMPPKNGDVVVTVNTILPVPELDPSSVDVTIKEGNTSALANFTYTTFSPSSGFPFRGTIDYAKTTANNIQSGLDAESSPSVNFALVDAPIITEMSLTIDEITGVVDTVIDVPVTVSLNAVAVKGDLLVKIGTTSDEIEPNPADLIVPANAQKATIHLSFKPLKVEDITVLFTASAILNTPENISEFTGIPDVQLRIHVLVEAQICFGLGSVVTTDQGEIEIQNITRENTINKIKVAKLYKTLYKKSNIVLMKKDSMKEGVPNKDTYITPRHKIYHNHWYYPIGDLVNGTDIVFEHVIEIPVYNVLLKSKRVGKMIVNNIQTQSLHPDICEKELGRRFRPYVRALH